MYISIVTSSVLRLLKFVDKGPSFEQHVLWNYCPEVVEGVKVGTNAEKRGFPSQIGQQSSTHTQVLSASIGCALGFFFLFFFSDTLNCCIAVSKAKMRINLSVYQIYLMHDPTAPPVATGSCNLVNTLLLIATMTQTLQVFLSPLSETSTPVTLLSHQRKQCVTKNAAVKKLG